MKNKHSQYLQKLINKNIKVIPLQEYNGSLTKINHKCTCNNIWEVVPNKVLTGTTCGCKNSNNTKISNIKYIDKLKVKNIKIIPLEKYNGSFNKIKHKCYCGEEWDTTPANVLKNHGCGCKNLLNQRDKFKDRPTILYYIKVDNLYKIGITLVNKKFKNIDKNIIRGRYYDKQYKKCSLEVIQYKIFDKGEYAYDKEQKILREFKKYKYIKDDMSWFAGHTELFQKNILEVENELVTRNIW